MEWGTPDRLRRLVLLRSQVAYGRSERIVKRSLMYFSNSRNVLVDEQRGFGKERQTLDQLVNLET